ncbi:HAMP domain-containing sensor histidine kinase [Bosea sp. TND4EK4]|uniref:sensor histidine kinase n=1 Tax=Bosea sp. TND4EK4 TaxID=1907408 RepID=UPI0009562978|nr:HAMP domain-containing sensor histidine kinase [Bosea sp. TND4EK4]SIR51044.1 two-component system, OmpR family, sensor kinase [Bosea sp. TND4EK4]
MTRVAWPPKGSLQRRLALALTGGVMALWLLATVAAGLLLRREIDEVFDSALQEVVQRVLPLAYAEILGREADALPDLQQVASVGAHREYITYIVRDATGRRLLESHDADPAQFPPNPAHGFSDGPSSRLYTEVAVSGTIVVTAAERPGHRQKAVRDAVGMLAWPLLLLLPLGIAGTWVLVAVTLRPVTAFRCEIEARGSGHLAPVSGAHLPSEIAPVAEAVNALMTRLRRALDAERSFTANSAHELRTPVAAALAQTQRLRAELPEGAARARTVEIETALKRLARLSEKLLQLARAEGAGPLGETPQNLVPALRLVLHDLSAEGTVEVALPPTGRFVSTLDMDAFAILARNLIENALKHGDGSRPVRVALTDEGHFSVISPGPVLGPEILAGMTQRFVRGAATADGAGLGLSIVQAITQGVGGEIAFVSPASGQEDGLEVRVQLPAAKLTAG